jgi:hypothetical protein
MTTLTGTEEVALFTGVGPLAALEGGRTTAQAIANLGGGGGGGLVLISSGIISSPVSFLDVVLQCYGNGHTPPTDGSHLTAGSWLLFGIPGVS